MISEVLNQFNRITEEETYDLAGGMRKRNEQLEQKFEKLKQLAPKLRLMCSSQIRSLSELMHEFSMQEPSLEEDTHVEIIPISTPVLTTFVKTFESKQHAFPDSKDSGLDHLLEQE